MNRSAGIVKSEERLQAIIVIDRVRIGRADVCDAQGDVVLHSVNVILVVGGHDRVKHGWILRSRLDYRVVSTQCLAGAKSLDGVADLPIGLGGHTAEVAFEQA